MKTKSNYRIAVLLLLALTSAVHGNFQQILWGSSTPSDYEIYSSGNNNENARSPPGLESRETARTGTPSYSEETGPKWRGGWTAWSEWSVCSRPCDGGVSRQLRRCNSRDGCKGEPQRYKICNMQPCQENQDFRARQCSAYDQVPYEGALLTWAPHYEDNEPCALTCRGKPQSHPQDGPQMLSEENEDETVVVAQLATKVQDGTRCRPGSLDMCINGKCQRVGCDLRIGSNRHVDECGVCGGDGSSCARPLYQWETAPMSLCSVTCGGGYRMARPVCRNRISGTDVEEPLCNASQRPEPAVQQCNMHPCPPKWSIGDWGPCSASCGGGGRSRRVECGSKGINGTLRLANEEACAGHRPRHLEACAETACPQWLTGQWSGCSVSCGSGMQVRGVQCAGGSSEGPSSDEGASSGSEVPCPVASRPPSQRPCSTGIVCPTYHPEHAVDDDIEDLIPGVVYHTQPLIQPYPPPNQPKSERLIGEQIVPSEATFIKDADWGPCSVTCGEGIRKREVHCKIFLEFSRTIAKLPDYKCAGPKPQEETERCAMEPCSMAYGTSYGDSNSPALYPSDTYNSRPSSFGDANIRVGAGVPGKSYSWKEQGYTHCSASCLGGVQELIVNCVRDDTHKIASPYMCAPETKPENRIRTCNDHPCPPRWNFSDFSPCTKSCGIGIQTREVNCIHEVTRGGGNTVIVPNSMCPQPSPPDRQYCNVLDCPVKWHTTQWSKCNKPCGGGAKERKVECKQVMAQSHVVERPESMCPPSKPPSSKPCHTKGCVQDTSTPTIITSETTYIQHDPKKKKVTLKIGGSATVFYGTQVKIKCPVKKFNRTKIRWAKDRTYLEKSKKFAISKKGALRIQELKLQDAGKYSCEAGKSVADLNLTVKPRPGEFPSSEEIERQKSTPLEDPNDSVDRNDARYRPFIGSEDQSHEQRPGTDHLPIESSIFKQRERNREKQREKERELQREKEREREMETTSQMPMRYYPAPDDDYSDKEGSGYNPEDAVPSQMSVAGDIKEVAVASSAARPMPHFLRLISNLQTFSNSRGHRMVSDINIITENRSEESPGTSTSSNIIKDYDRTSTTAEKDFTATEKDFTASSKIYTTSEKDLATSGKDFTKSEKDLTIAEDDFTIENDYNEDLKTIPDGEHVSNHDSGRVFRKILDIKHAHSTKQANKDDFNTLPDENMFRKSTAKFDNSIDGDSNSVDAVQEQTTAKEKMGGFRFSTLSEDDNDGDGLGSITVLGKGKADSIRFEWVITDWSKCSVTCGGSGFQMRAAHCMVRLENTTQDVESTLCEDAGLESPATLQKCGQEDCPSWLTKEWSSCSTARCFDWNTAMQRRVVECVSGEGVGVAPSLCPHDQRPQHRQECYNDKCKGVWKTDHWSECGGPCGHQGNRYRILRCVWFGTRRPAGSACRHRPRPAVIRPCNTAPCQHNQKSDCKDSSKFCQNVRAMNMCRVQRYQQQCCQSCKKH